MLANGRSRPRVSNGKIAAICAGVTLGMVGAGFAAVPAYRAFCQITGFDGTISRADSAPARILDETITIRFDANARDIPWDFKPEQVRQSVRIGATGLAYFTVVNTSDAPVTGQATFNILPETAGAYFKKTQCFCFEEQTLAPGEEMEFAVVYFVDPGIAADPETSWMDELTLSYTFFPSKNGAIELSAATAANRPLGEGVKAGL
jgi:cytochrome c oxidase assembly protein subunit 11